MGTSPELRAARKAVRRRYLAIVLGASYVTRREHEREIREAELRGFVLGVEAMAKKVIEAGLEGRFDA